jgi:hypothetical protein
LRRSSNSTARCDSVFSNAFGPERKLVSEEIVGMVIGAFQSPDPHAEKLVTQDSVVTFDLQE